jgi:fatty-acyl-CoA synthase
MSEAAGAGRDLAYERLIAENGADATWGGFDENTASGLCYTSGTTGDPKGVLYSHRSNYLHTLMTLQKDVMALSITDVVLPVVPMFHANAWGITFSAPAVGAKLVMPAPRWTARRSTSCWNGGRDLLRRRADGVADAAAAHPGERPAVLDAQAGGDRRVRVPRGDHPRLPRGLRRGRDPRLGHDRDLADGDAGSLPPEQAAMPFDQQVPYRLKQGRAPPGSS